MYAPGRERFRWDRHGASQPSGTRRMKHRGDLPARRDAALGSVSAVIALDLLDDAPVAGVVPSAPAEPLSWVVYVAGPHITTY